MLRRLRKLMGCICSKGIFSNDGNSKDRERKPSKSSNRFVGSYNRDEDVVEPDGVSNEARARLISSPLGTEIESEAYRKVSGSGNDKRSKAVPRRAASDVGVPLHHQQSTVGNMPHGEKGAQIVAGWPSWLSSVAGEAINGWIPRRADSFEKLEKIGQGTYSSVYRARDLETDKIVALKKVRFANMDPESVRFMAREILILRRLDHPNVMKLEGLITSRASGSLYLIFEYMEHDLAGLASSPGVKFTEAQIKCYMQQLLRGLEHCHSHGVLHRDIKGSNLLLDDNGILKIADFGLATLHQPHQKQPLTSRVVTLWYRPPELLLGSTDYGPSVDLWSSGCILAELFAGKPIMSGRTEVEQLHKIFKLCGSPSETYWKMSKLPHATVFKPQQPYKRILRETFRDMPESAMTLLEILLAVEPENRGSASSALQSEFFSRKPLPSDPSSLPKHPPSKEFDAKLRDEEARRRKAANKGRGNEPVKKNVKESKAVPAPDANAELQASIQRVCGRGKPDTSSISEKFATEEEGGAGFPIEPSRHVPSKASSHYGKSIRLRNLGFAPREDVSVVSNHDLSRRGESKPRRSYVDRAAAQLSRFSNSVGVRGNSRLDDHRETAGRYDHLDGGESSGKPEWANHQLDRPDSSYRKGREVSRKDFNAVYSPRKNRIQHSGPLMAPGGNIEEMLKEHEKQIQHAVRKARLDKAKTREDYSETESIFLHGKNGR